MIKSIVRKVVAVAVAAALCISFVFALDYDSGDLSETEIEAIMNVENFAYFTILNANGQIANNYASQPGTLKQVNLASSSGGNSIYIRYSTSGIGGTIQGQVGWRYCYNIPLLLDIDNASLTFNIGLWGKYINEQGYDFYADPVFYTLSGNVKTEIDSTFISNISLATNSGENLPTLIGKEYEITVNSPVDAIQVEVLTTGVDTTGFSGSMAFSVLNGTVEVPPPKTIDDVIAELHIIQDKLDAIIEELQDQQAGMSGTIQQIVQNQQIIIEDTAEDEAQFALIQQQQQAVEDRIDELEEKMELVQPVDPDDLHLSGEQVLSTDYDVQSFSDVFGSFLENQFILQMMMTVLGLGLLSYIFFGKKV